MLPKLLHFPSVSIQEDGPSEIVMLRFRIAVGKISSLESALAFWNTISWSICVRLNHFGIWRGGLWSLVRLSFGLSEVETIVEYLLLVNIEAIEARVSLNRASSCITSPSNAWVRAQIEQMDAEYARLLAVKHPDAHTVEVAHRSTGIMVTKRRNYLLHLGLELGQV